VVFFQRHERTSPKRSGPWPGRFVYRAAMI
jgi:hypothetical protein